MCRPSTRLNVGVKTADPEKDKKTRFSDRPVVHKPKHRKARPPRRTLDLGPAQSRDAEGAERSAGAGRQTADKEKKERVRKPVILQGRKNRNRFLSHISNHRATSRRSSSSTAQRGCRDSAAVRFSWKDLCRQDERHLRRGLARFENQAIISYFAVARGNCAAARMAAIPGAERATAPADRVPHVE